MKISALDLRQAQFRLSWRGYNPMEVQQILQMAAAELETLVRENEALRNELQDAVGKLSEKREQEGLLRDTLMEAQKARQGLEEAARREAEVVIADAEMKARELILDAHRSLNDMTRQLADIRKEKIWLRNEVRSGVKTLIDWLDTDEEIEKEEEDGQESRLHFFAPPDPEQARG